MKEELLTTLPHDPVQQQRIQDAVKELNNLRLQQDGCKESAKDILTKLKEQHFLCPKYIKKLANVAYDRMYGDGKVAIEYKHASQIVEDAEELFN